MQLEKKEVNNHREKIKSLGRDDRLYYLINLYSKGYSLINLSNIFNGSIEKIIEILERHDLKNCSQSNCPNQNPQSRYNFYSDKTKSDGLSSRCKSCNPNRRSYKDQLENPEEIKKHRQQYQKEGDPYIIELYSKRYTCQSLSKY